MVWEPQATVWNEYYTCAKAYFSIYGDCNVPVRSVWPKNDPEGLRLGSWLAKQRQLHKRRCLSAERIKKLELIGMIWCVNASSAVTEVRPSFNCFAVDDAKSENKKADGQDGESSNQQIIVRLNTMARSLRTPIIMPKSDKRGMQVQMPVPRQMQEPKTSWNSCFKAAQAYHAMYGHCNATRDVTWPENDSEGLRLGVWLANQRVAHRKGRLLPEQLSRLKSIDMAWEPQVLAWDVGFGHAKDYFAVYGHCNVSFRAAWPENDRNGFRLGVWVSSQRKKYRHGKLSVEQVELLESIGMVWKPRAS